MARSSSNLILKGFSGKLGELVVKQYANKIVITRLPDMSRVKKSELQKLRQDRFRQAVAYAQSIIHDPKKKASYAKKLRKGESVYHAAIKEFLS